jgi:hypothetical protein
MTNTDAASVEGDASRLLAAMVRVLSGRPTVATPGDLTITAVALEAQLKRHHLTHKHTDVKDLFYQLRDNHANPVIQQAADAAAEVAELKKKLARAQDDTRKWRSTAHTFARAINVLTLENDRLREQPANVRTLPSAR